MADTSAQLGTMVLGAFRLGVVLGASDGLPQDAESDGTPRANPWTRRTAATTTWTPR